MQQSTPPPVAPEPRAEPRFDVFIRLPRGMQPEEAQRRVVEQGGLTPEQGERIAQALQQVPVVQVRRNIDEARARKTEHQLSLAGLRVEVKRLPTAAAAAEPAAAVAPPPVPAAPAPAPARLIENPEDYEFDLSALPEDDDATLFASLTTRPATRPAPRLNAASGGAASTLPAPGLASGALGGRRLPRLAAAAALVGVAGVAFVLGRLSLPWPPSETPAHSAQAIERVLVAVGAPPALADASAPAASAARVGAAEEPPGTDALAQIAKTERAQGRGTTLEHAVALAQTQAGTAAVPAVPAAARAGDRMPASLAQGLANTPLSAGAAALPQGAPMGAVPPLPAAVRATLAADYAVQLAEFGQAARAREVLGRLRADALQSGDPAVGASAQRAEVLLLAWSLAEANGAGVDGGIAALRQLVHGIDSPAARAALMGRVATVLARHDNVPDALALACLADAGEALKGVADGAQRQAAIEDWLVDTGDLLLAQLARHGRLGRWPQAQSLVEQLDSLAGQARGSHAQLQLKALRARAQDLMGHGNQAEALLADALKGWGQQGGAARRAEELRALATRVGDLGSPELFQATAQLATAADALRGEERARALTQLALMQAEAGETERFEAIKAMLRQAPEAARPEQAALTAQLLVGGELAAARAEQRAGAFGLAEARVRKVAAYLL